MINTDHLVNTFAFVSSDYDIFVGFTNTKAKGDRVQQLMPERIIKHPEYKFLRYEKGKWYIGNINTFLFFLNVVALASNGSR